MISRFFLFYTVAERAKLPSHRQIASVRINERFGVIETKPSCFVQILLVNMDGKNLGKKHMVAAKLLFSYYPALYVDRAFLYQRNAHTFA